MESDRPSVAIGHVTLRTADVRRAAQFYQRLGLRLVVERDALAILELRGGTHLLLFRAKGKPRPGPIRSFDLMVDDAEPYREGLIAEGFEATALRRDVRSGHQMFEVTDPDGHVISVLSSHTEGRPV